MREGIQDQTSSEKHVCVRKSINKLSVDKIVVSRLKLHSTTPGDILGVSQPRVYVMRVFNIQTTTSKATRNCTVSSRNCSCLPQCFALFNLYIFRLSHELADLHAWCNMKRLSTITPGRYLTNNDTDITAGNKLRSPFEQDGICFS